MPARPPVPPLAGLLLAGLLLVGSFLVGVLPAWRATAQPVAPPPAVIRQAGPDADRPPVREVLVDAASLDRSLDRVEEGLAALRALADTDGLSPELRRALETELTNLRAELEAVRTAVREAPAGLPAPTEVLVIEGPGAGALRTGGGPGATDASPPPMTRADFEDALVSLEKHGFASEKLEVLGDLAAHNWFLVEQARRLLESFTFGKDRLLALERLAPRIVDPQNHFRLYETFTFESDKTQARRILAAQQP